ncbi:ENTH domain-containing protein [Peziza echinospora]|nr:ENTH domain-containing protein [Peziza echinospora]
MDLQAIKDQIAGLSLYDVKAAVRKAQNVVMNYTEMEAKVREATNNEPWGASSTLMQEIANGTYNYQLLNEIMPMIYKRFTDKAAEEWRQIYKALQLLEFLVKNGSEQVIDDARSHVSTIKMLRQFHFIDANGKDQGVNVRNRAKELGDLLGDVDRIRAERKKARAAKTKYGGVEGGSMAGGFGGTSSFGGSSSGSRSRFGGFGSDDNEYGGYHGNTVYGDGGGFGASTSTSGRGYNDEGAGAYGGSSRSDGTRQKFEEYDEYDEAAPGSRASARRSQPAAPATPKAAPPPKKVTAGAPAVDLLFDSAPVIPSNGKSTTSNPLEEFNDFTTSSSKVDDDDFDDFQAAPPPPSNNNAHKLAARLSAPPPPASATLNSVTAATPFAAPQPRSSQQAAGITGLVGMTTPNIAKSAYSPPPINNNFSALGSLSLSSTPAPAKNTQYQPAQPNYFTSFSTNSSAVSVSSSIGVLSPTSTTTTTAAAAAKPAAAKAANDAFGSIWSSAASASIKKPSSTEPASTAPKGSLADLAKSRAQTGLWGNSSTQNNSSSGGFGAFGGMSGGASSGQKKTGGNDLDDLLG